MLRIAISNWAAYAPFRASAKQLGDLDVELVDGAVDRVEGLVSGMYAAAPMSTYALAEALPKLDGHVAVSWTPLAPRGYGSDRIVATRSITSLEELHGCRIGVTPNGLEPHLFEHLFDFAGLPPKTDYVVLPDRNHIEPAMRDGSVEAAMLAQPLRSRLLVEFPHMVLFEGDHALPRFGLYAPMVHRLRDWIPGSLRNVQQIVTDNASVLASLDSESLISQFPGSFEGIPDPKREVAETIQWLTLEESDTYTRSDAALSLRNHLRQVAQLRSDRFGAALSSDEQIDNLIA